MERPIGASVRPGMSTFPDTPATSPDTVGTCVRKRRPFAAGPPSLFLVVFGAGIAQRAVAAAEVRGAEGVVPQDVQVPGHER